MRRWLGRLKREVLRFEGRGRASCAVIARHEHDRYLMPQGATCTTAPRPGRRVQVPFRTSMPRVRFVLGVGEQLLVMPVISSERPPPLIKHASHGLHSFANLGRLTHTPSWSRRWRCTFTTTGNGRLLGMARTDSWADTWINKPSFGAVRVDFSRGDSDHVGADNGLRPPKAPSSPPTLNAWAPKTARHMD